MTVKIIDPEKAKQMFESDEAIILDIRDHNEHKAEKITGSINHPLSDLDCNKVKLQAAHKACIIQCLGGIRAKQAYKQLEKDDPSINCYILEGGIKNWKSCHLPTEKNSTAISLIRQVQIIVGGGILIGSILSLFSLNFIWIPLFFGAGLLFAGLSGHCTMLKFLERMPWNN